MKYKEVMSSWFAAVQNENKSKLRHEYCLNNNHYPKNILKPKNVFKSKFDKDLKKKLKKYKLRRDGQEDQDVNDVSHMFLSVLKIKSSGEALRISSDSDIEPRPRNYLFKMAKTKHKKTQQISQESEIAVEKSEVTCIPPTSSQEIRATDAFKLMMASRNKSIGGNSPGKEVASDPLEKQEILEKKEIKAKRYLVLQKLAESKGSLKRKEIEECEEQCIKNKMEKRAERLKNMIKKKGRPKKIKNESSKLKEETIKSEAPRHKIELIDLFNDESVISNKSDDDCTLSEVKLKQKSKEDEEFLKKLSPSLRKRENMMCYFRKIDKNPSTDTDGAHNSSVDVIKVKVQTPRNKRKRKLRKNLSLNKVSDDILKDHDVNKSYESVTVDAKICNEDTVTPTRSNAGRKRKRKENSANIVCDATETNGKQKIDDAVTELNEVKEEGRRSKRNIKKPLKYVDDIQLSSSDEELHIFTPKKRKPLEEGSKRIHKSKIKDEVCALDVDEKKPVNSKKEVKVYKKPAKLAPIFNTKPILTPEELKAKQNFLYSGVPEQLKKIVNQQKNNTPDFINSHPVVVHVQQKEAYSVQSSHFPPLGLQIDTSSDEDETQAENVIPLSNFLNLTANIKQPNTTLTATEGGESILQNIKNSYPKFPVYRTYRLLRGKCKGDFKDSSCPDLESSIEVIKGLSDIINENPHNLTWTDKYKALSTNQMIGNFEAVKDLKKWLVSWTENEMKPRKSATNDSDSSDFYYDSDIDSRDSMKTTDNLLVISGPVGCGKSSIVYAVAAELAIKVIEVNASSKRTGKMMLQDLQEATQSHKVNRGNSSAENSQKSQEIIEKPLKTYKNRGRPKKVYENGLKIALAKKSKVVSSSGELSQENGKCKENGRTAMSLILIDDADIVFDQDDGFSSAIGQLVQSSKRPVILITSSLSCLHLQRFIQCGRVLNMQALLPKMLGTWLDILCLADRSMCWRGLGAKFLDHYKGDIRKTINSMQFYLSSETKQSPQDSIGSQNTDVNVEDEGSSSSWSEKEGTDERNFHDKRTDNELHNAWKYFMGGQINSLENCNPTELFNAWWSIPKLLNTLNHNSLDNNDKSQEKPSTDKNLKTVAEVLDAISVADYLSHSISPGGQKNICSQSWREFESNSVSELEDLTGYSRSKNMNTEILQSLVNNSVLFAQKTLQMENQTDIEHPGMLEERQRNRKLSRHESLSNFLHPSSVLDRKALALDYWSTCRSICRTEKLKTDVVYKRNNRHCHYFKPMNVLCKTDSLDKLCDSLSSSSNLK